MSTDNQNPDTSVLILDVEEETKQTKPKDSEEGDGGGDDLLDELFGSISDEEEEIENFRLPLSEIPKPQNELYRLKFPKSVKIDMKPFDNDEEDIVTTPTIRFRYLRDETDGNVKTNAEGTYMKESNSRIIKWSDGSSQIFIGKEGYDIFSSKKAKSKSHIFYKSVDDSFFIDHGKFKEYWNVKSKIGRGKGAANKQFSRYKKYKSKTKLTDKILTLEDIQKEKLRPGGSLERDLKNLKEKQRKSLDNSKIKINKEFLEQEYDDDQGNPSLSIKQLKHKIRRGKRKKKKSKKGKRKRKRRRRKESDDEYEDDFVDDDDSDGFEEEEIEKMDEEKEINVNENEEIVEGRKRKRKSRRSKGSSGSEEDGDIMKELILYDDESGSDSDETYRPFKKKKKKSEQ